MNKKRRLISFESDIIEDVMKKTGGKYTYDQINDVFLASLSYISNLCRYTDNTKVVIPHVGEVICNRREMDLRRKKLERIKARGKRLMDYETLELKCLESKINDILSEEEKGNILNGDPLIKDNRRFIRYLKGKLKFENIQDIQQKQFK